MSRLFTGLFSVTVAILFFALSLSVVNTSSAQVVRLPTVRQFSSTSSVLVPDRGSTSLGGNRFARRGQSSRRGLGLPIRSSGSTLGGTGISVSVEIIDLAALDRAILAAAEDRFLNLDDPLNEDDRTVLAASLHRRLGTSREDTPISRLQSIPQRKTHYDTVNSTAGLPTFGSNAEDIRYFLEKGKSAKQKGRWSSAQVFYEEAWKRMTPEQQSKVLAYVQRSPRRGGQSTATQNQPRQSRRSASF